MSILPDFLTLDIFAIALFFIGFLGLIISRNALKSIIFMLMMEASVIMFWLFVGSRTGVTPPIIHDPAMLEYLPAIADPLPQALMLTAIIIGISVTAINITMLNALLRKYGSTDWAVLAELAGTDVEDGGISDDALDPDESDSNNNSDSNSTESEGA